MDKICPVCQADSWNTFLSMNTQRVMTSDHRIIPGCLDKDICKTCGVVTNSRPFSEQEIRRIYNEEYTLNTSGGEEHQFYTSVGPVSRSQVYVDWILPHLPEKFSSFLEVGCGEGNVLKRLKNRFPHTNFYGIDGSAQACKLARAKGLDVENKLILSPDDNLPSSDIILAIGVLEHVENVSEFIHNIRIALNDGGRLIFCLPIQNYRGYDIFFSEHLWHFTANHVASLLRKNGLRIIHIDYEHPTNHGFGLFVCTNNGDLPDLSIPMDPEPVTANRDIWLERFAHLDNWLKEIKNERLALFGSGEVTTLFLTFTSLGDRKIVACIDEDPAKIGKKKHGIPIHGIDWLAEGYADTIMLTINPKYHELVKGKLKPFAVELYTYV